MAFLPSISQLPARRRTAGILALGASAIFASAGMAAKPVARGHFAGSLPDYMNDAPKWHRETTGSVSFQTSKDAKRILDFHGTYSYYCGSGTSYIKATYIDVNSAGRFSYDFHFPIRMSNGKSAGTSYVAISGQFLKGGRSVDVSYLVDSVFEGKSTISGKPVRHPYSTQKPDALGCASWVHGTVRAR